MAVLGRYSILLLLVVSSCNGLFFGSKARSRPFKTSSMGVFRLLSKMMPLQEEVYMTGPELIKQAGYPLEIHEVETPDGYVLELHRIPGRYGEYASNEKSRNAMKVPVLLQSALVTSGSTSFVLFERNQSLAYLLADAGYDVWIGNLRGSEFSWHKEMTPKDYDFWKFTMDDLATDIASSIDYIREKTGFDKIFSINSKFLSMSNLMLFSKKPEYNDRVIINIMLSPLWQVADSRLVDVISGGVQTIIDFLRPVVDALRGDLWASTEFNRWVGRFTCYVLPNCLDIMNTIMDGGTESNNFNVSRGPALMGHVLGSYSARPIHHVVMTIYDREVREYDWSKEENKFRYGREKTEAYDLKKVSVETLLVYGANDLLAGTEEMKNIAKQIQHPILMEVKDPTWSMITVYAGIRNKEMAYDQIFDLMKKRSQNVVNVE